jgi:hypothetical protein
VDGIAAQPRRISLPLLMPADPAGDVVPLHARFPHFFEVRLVTGVVDRRARPRWRGVYPPGGIFTPALRCIGDRLDHGADNAGGVLGAVYAGAAPVECW